MIYIKCHCNGWNPWHHPYTLHAAWCPAYKTEPEEAQLKNENFHQRGGFYVLGNPVDKISHYPLRKEGG